MYENDIYEEDFENSRVLNDPHSIKYVLEQIAEVHSEEAGWSLGEPEITPNSDNKTVTIKIHLTKSNTNGLGR